MKIQNITLTDKHIGRSVRYIPLHANGDLSHKDIGNGYITSCNDHYVFVDYGHGSHPATDPTDLIWG